ncbi:MAG: Glu-tRNA(Gln) amidotransferase subunit GatD [Deltaproteobacteria bacterium]|nr:Glu-tRNA(Gln) amidotransferase subunit GatD [Deltaproteobacteria bacterium]
MSAFADRPDRFKGYRGAALEVLERFQVGVWSQVRVVSTRGRFEGLILPRQESADASHVVLKMITGYNVGVEVSGITEMVEVGYREAHYKIPEQDFPYAEGKPNVTLLGTGGTIASRLDYRTGAVIPAFSPGELYGSVPELADTCNLTTKKLYGVFSENIGPDHWIGLAKAIGEEIERGVDGIVIGHGTDTMAHTAAVLSFMVQDSPVPIVLVGSQRSSDRPSSDAALNLIHATKTAGTSDMAEVMVCMFGPTSDQYGLLHRGTRVRKMHSSYRSTFRTVSDIPLAMVDRHLVTPLREDYKRRRTDKNVTIDAVFDDRVSIVYYYPSMKPDVIDSLIQAGYRGIVIAGTGLGHVNKGLYPALQRAKEAGVHVFMTVQTLWGHVQMNVYETGRDMQALGVIPGANLLPEVAFAKLGWVLAHTDDPDEVRRMMLTPIAGEITEREPFDGYMILQGGLPEVEEFNLKHMF